MPQNVNRVEWISCKGSMLQELELIPATMKFGSKPKYIIFVKGKYFNTVDGLNYPVLTEELKKSYEEMDKEEL